MCVLSSNGNVVPTLPLGTTDHTDDTLIPLQYRSLLNMRLDQRAELMLAADTFAAVADPGKFVAQCQSIRICQIPGELLLKRAPSSFVQTTASIGAAVSMP